MFASNFCKAAKARALPCLGALAVWEVYSSACLVCLVQFHLCPPEGALVANAPHGLYFTFQLCTTYTLLKAAAPVAMSYLTNGTCLLSAAELARHLGFDCMHLQYRHGWRQGYEVP